MGYRIALRGSTWYGAKLSRLHTQEIDNFGRELGGECHFAARSHRRLKAISKRDKVRKMTPEERVQILELMATNARLYQDAIEGISLELATRRPGPDRWSALECAEHVALVEHGL